MAIAVFHDQQCLKEALTALNGSCLDFDRVGFFACLGALARIVWASDETGWPRRLGAGSWQVVIPWRDPTTGQRRGKTAVFHELPVFCGAGKVVASQGWPLLDHGYISAWRLVPVASYLAGFILPGHAARLGRAVDAGGLLLGVDLGECGGETDACRALLAHNDDWVELHDFRSPSTRRFSTGTVQG